MIGALRADTADSNPIRHLAPTSVIDLGPLSPAELASINPGDLHALTGGHPQAVAAAMGHTREDLAAAVGDVFLARFRAEGPQAYRILQTAATLEQPFRPDILATVLEVARRTKGGVFLPTEITLLPLDNGHQVYLIGLVQDRSDHRQPHP